MSHIYITYITIYIYYADTLIILFESIYLIDWMDWIDWMEDSILQDPWPSLSCCRCFGLNSADGPVDMSDDEGPRKGKGKKGKGGGGGGGKGGKDKGKGGKSSGGGINVSRLQVLPKFLQEIHAKYKPSKVARLQTGFARVDPSSGFQTITLIWSVFEDSSLFFEGSSRDVGEGWVFFVARYYLLELECVTGKYDIGWGCWGPSIEWNQASTCIA